MKRANGEHLRGATTLFLLFLALFAALPVRAEDPYQTLWTRQMGCSAADGAYDLAIPKASGDIYMAGTTWCGLDGNTFAGGDDLFIVKYDATGNKLWLRQKGTSKEDWAVGVAVDTNGNAYMVGFTERGLDGCAFRPS